MLSTLLRPAAAALFVLCSTSLAMAQTAASAPVESQPAAQGAAEPKIQRSVVEDDNAKIEELRVRGAVKSITVTSKIGSGISYEVVPVDAGRNQNASPSNDRGSTGKSLFRVLSF